MSYNSWSLGRGGVPYSGIGSGGMGGWGGGTGGERQRDEAIFTSLVPVNGRVSGSQVKNVFQASGLTQQQLAKIWTMADRDGDGYINMSEFCSAMAAIRQAKQQLQQTTSLQWPSKGGGAGGTFGGGMQSQPLDPSQQISKSLTFPSLKEPTSPMVTQSLQSVGIVGKGVTSEGWKISPAEKRRYVTQFGTYDRMKTGYLPGVDIKPVLNQSGLDQTILAKIWTLADIDKDGRLSVEEFSIAMHLIDKAKIGVTLPLTLPPDLLPSSNDSGTPPSTVATTPTSKTPWTFEDKKRENFDAGRQELERRRRAIQEKQEKEEAEKERKRRQEEEQRRQQEMEAEKRRQAELERQNRRALEIQRERERQLAKLTEQREAELREEERRRKEEWARRRQVELEGVKEWEMKALRALQSQHSNLENELQQLDQQKMASRDSVLRQSSLCDELRKALRSMRLSDEVKRAEITKLRTELHALQSKLTSLATQRAQFQASLQARNPQSLQYQKERQVYQDGIMGVAAVLAGLRSTLKSGAESYQKQEQLMKNNIMTFSELQTELQKNTAKTSTLKSQVAHHRSQWEERERRGREETKRRQEAEKRERQEKERLAREAREMRIKKQQSQALKEAKEAKAREEKAKATEELTRLMKKGTTSPSPPPQVTPTRHSIPPAPNPRPKRLPPKPAPYQPSTTTTTTTTANEAIKKLAAILNQEITSSPLVAIATTTNSNIGVAGKKEVKAKDEKAKVKEVKKKVIELKQRKAEIEKQKRSLPSKPMPYPGSKLRKQTSLSTSPPPLLDIEASCDTSAQSTGFIPNPQSSFNPLEPLRTSSETSLSNVFGVSGGESSPVKFPTTENREIVQPVFQLGQPGLSLKGQPVVADKGRATVTGSQVEALSVVDGDPLYATVNKTRSNTRSNLDYVSAGRRSSEKPPSVSPPPKDWVVIGNEEISRSNSEQIMTAQTISSSEPSATSSTQPITSTPKRTTTSPSLVTSNSTNQPLSSSWVDLQSTTNHARDETTNEPLYMSPRQHHGDEATTSSHRIITYRALYSFTAKQESEVSFQEGDVFNSIPGELPSNGWLLVEIKGQQGLVPESYLEEVDLGRGSLERELEDAACQGDQQATEKAKVMFTWKGSKDNHLSIKKGQVIDILTKSEKWWSGRVEGKVGWFPKTFVKIVEVDEGEQQVTVAEEAGGQNQSVATATVSQPSRSETTPPSSTTAAAVTTSADLYQALYDYDSIEPGDLRFKTGDVIKVTDKDGEWWKGSLNEQFGSFPSNYVKHHVPETTPLRSSTVPAIPPSPSPSPSSSSLASDTSVTSHVKPLVARVTKQYMATKETELSLKAGQYVKVYKQSGSGWWHGELQSRGKQRQTGWFPADHVDLLQKPNTTSSTTNSTPPPSVSSSSSSSGQQAAGSNNSGSAAQSVLGAQRSKSPLIDILDPPDPHSLSQNLVLALYTYTAASSDELTFHKGSVITVLVKKGEWWKGELNGVAGLFPSNYVQPLNETPATTSEATRWAESVSPEVLASVSKTERKRQEAIFELLSSERNYTDSLKFVREVYFEPMVDSGVLTDEEMNKVRVNWDELIQCNGNMLNAFLVRLRTSGSVVKNIGDILHTQIPLLMPHVRWCSCQLTACTLLQSKSSDPLFKEFEQKCAEDQRAAGLPLSSFLLKPMQRITKYPLLIQRILDYTTEDNTDRDELQAALEEAQKLCHSVNEAVRSKENTEHLEWLQNNVQFSLDETLIFNSQTNFLGQRKLLHWGKLFKIRGNRDLVGFLFNDFYLLVKPKHFFSRAATPAELEPFGKNEFVMYRTPYLLGDVKVNKASAEQHGPSVFLMNYPSEEKDIPLKADSDPARDVWIKMIQDAKHEYLKTKRRSEQEIKKKWAQTMKHSVGVLKVTVVKAEDLKASDPNGKSDPFCVLSFSQQEENTPVVNSNLNPKWNYTVQFAVHDLNQDVLEITVFDQDIFSPNDFLGCGRVVLKDLLQEGDSPWRKQVLLEDVSSGEVELVLELSLNKSDLLL